MITPPELAMLLDTEGSITIGKGFQVCVEVKMARAEELFAEAQTTYGGHIYKGWDRMRPGRDHQNILRWSIQGPTVIPVLSAALPHLRLKKRQAEVALAAAVLKPLCRGQNRRRPEGTTFVLSCLRKEILRRNDSCQARRALQAEEI